MDSALAPPDNILELETYTPSSPPSSPPPERCASIDRRTTTVFRRVITSVLVWSAIAAIGGYFGSRNVTLRPRETFLISVIALPILLYILCHKKTTQTVKQLTYEATLGGVVVANRCFPASMKYPHHTHITDKLILGAIPLLNHNHQSFFEGRKMRVLSLNEPFEFKPSLFGDPITPDDWKQLPNVEFLNLPTPDYEPIHQEKIDEGVAFIKKGLEECDFVYVHCKAGVGRSALTVACYLIKHGISPDKSKMTTNEAVDYLKSKRWIIIKPRQLEQARIFEERCSTD